MMFKFITGLPSIQKWLIIGLSIALIATIAGSSITFWVLNNTIEKRDKTIENKNTEIIALNVDVERWKGATENLTDLTYKQNKGIQDAADAEKRAYERYLAADKKSKPIVKAIKDQINRSSVGGIDFEGCKASLDRWRSELEGSEL